MRNITVFTIVALLSFWTNIIAQSKTNLNDTINPCIECKELLKFNLPDVKIISAEIIGTDIKSCRVMGIIGDEIKFGLRLPKFWNSRFIMAGGGAFVGAISNGELWRINQGYATVATDTGHEGQIIDGSWALNNIERQANFGFLAVHRTAEVSKAIIAYYYGSKPRYSYFSGCSRGGGQALMEAQRYPDDFDGIICGGPGFDWPAMALKFIDSYKAQYPYGYKDNDGILTYEKIKLLNKIVMEQFDQLDGVKDNIINDPGSCTIDYSKLKVCSAGIQSDDCFTKDQIKVIKTFYDGVSVKGAKVYPGYLVGSETGWYIPQLAIDTTALKFGQKTFFGVFGSEIFKYFVFNDPEWDLYHYDYSNFFKETKYAASFLNATSTDYSEFRKRGGKMIINHGWADPIISALSTVQYYNDIKSADKESEEYIRLFLVPGGGHCGMFDVGPVNVDWLEYLRDWVENGNPPEKVIVSKSENNKVIMTRPVFPYPSKAVYNGKGDPNDANSFTEFKK
jgi:feruloyl esterase